MDEIQSLMHGFGVALTLTNLALMFIGVILGVIIGVLPGLGGANGVAILLPLTFAMAQTPGRRRPRRSSCCRASTGGRCSAARSPRSCSTSRASPGRWPPPSTAIRWRSRAAPATALTAAFTSSFVGALVAVIVITFLSPVVASFALEFGPPEFFSVYLLTFCAFVGMSKEPPFKTLASMMLGFALAAVGTDTVTGTLRLTFGSTHLLTGFDFLVAVIGLFGIGEILLTLEEGLAFRGAKAKINLRRGARDLEGAAALLADLDPLVAGGLLHGHRARRRDAGLVHELRRGAALLAGRRQVRHRPGRGRGGAGNRGARRRHLGAAADAHARRARARPPRRCCSAAC